MSSTNAAPEKDRERFVGANRKLQNEPLLMAVFGQERDSKSHRMSSGTRLNDAAFHSDLASVGTRYTKEHLGDLRTAGADEAEEAQDLAGPNLKANILYEASTSESPHTEDRGPNLRIFLRKEGSGFSADHVTNGLSRSEIGGGRRDDALAGAQDCNFVAQPEDLINEVTDEENGHTLFLQPFNDLKEAVYLRGVKWSMWVRP